MLLLLLIRANDATKLSSTRLHIDRELLLMMIRIGIPSGFLGSVFSVSNVAAQSAINSLGADVVAGSAAALNIEIYIQFFGNAFASAGTTAVSQNYGAGDLRRCRRVIGMSIALCEIATVTLSAAAFLSGRKLLLIFVSDAAVIEIAMRRMRYTILFKFITSVMDITNGCLQGFRYTLVPALISVFGVCGVRLLWLWLVFPAHPSIDCVMVIYPFTQGFAAVVQLFLCMRPSRIPVRKKHK